MMLRLMVPINHPSDSGLGVRLSFTSYEIHAACPCKQTIQNMLQKQKVSEI